MYRSVLVEHDAETRVATLTLNRPTALNAVTQSMLDDFGAFWRWVMAEDDVHVVVVRASRDSKAFTSGLDVKGGDDGTDRVKRHDNLFANRSVLQQIAPRMHGVYKPVVVAVHGICAGAGVFLVNDADIAICSDDAEFFDPHLSIGITSAAGPLGMAHRVPLGEVLRFTLLSNAERLSAQTALRISLVTEITAPDTLWARADEIARIVAAYDPVAVQGTLRAIWESREIGLKAALDRASLYSDVGRASSGKRADKIVRQQHRVR